MRKSIALINKPYQHLYVNVFHKNQNEHNMSFFDALTSKHLTRVILLRCNNIIQMWRALCHGEKQRVSSSYVCVQFKNHLKTILVDTCTEVI